MIGRFDLLFNLRGMCDVRVDMVIGKWGLRGTMPMPAEANDCSYGTGIQNQDSLANGKSGSADCHHKLSCQHSRTR
jgi:hypothetical protein